MSDDSIKSSKRVLQPNERISNAIAIVLLFVTGYAFGRIAEYRPWLTGLTMVMLGSVLVAITMALGG